MRKIESQAIWCNQRTFLSHVFTEQLPKRRMQQVGCRVIQDRTGPAVLVNARSNLVTDSKTAGVADTEVQMGLATLLGIVDRKTAVLGRDQTTIAYLAGRRAL